jgi:hypothetical protein
VVDWISDWPERLDRRAPTSRHAIVLEDFLERAGEPAHVLASSA